MSESPERGNTLSTRGATKPYIMLPSSLNLPSGATNVEKSLNVYIRV